MCANLCKLVPNYAQQRVYVVHQQSILYSLIRLVEVVNIAELFVNIADMIKRLHRLYQIFNVPYYS